MPTFKENIARLKQGVRQDAEYSSQQYTSAAEASGRRGIQEAEKVATSLSGFSKTLREWKKEDIKKKQEEGVREARRARLDKAQTLNEHAQKIQEIEDAQKQGLLLEEFDSAKAQDTAYQEIKAQMLTVGGEGAYPDAERIAKLSPWAQVGFAKEKLRVFNESFDDKLAHEMQNSEVPITLGNITFTPKQIHGNSQALPMKEAAIQILSEQIREKAGINKFSDELLKIGGTDDAIIKSQDAQLAKYRKRHNIDSSINTRGKANLEWKSSEKTGDDLHRLLLINSNTVDKNNNILGNAGAWEKVMSTLTSEGVAVQDPGYADKMGALEIPKSLAQKIGAKPGTTFAQQWPGRFASLKTDIKQGYVKQVDEELKFQKADGKKLESDFIEAAKESARNGKVLSTAEVNQWKAKAQLAGVGIPEELKRYETNTMLDERVGKQYLEALAASQQGRLTREQLQSVHPLAAAEYWEKVEKWEAADLKAFDSEKKIKAHLDTVWESMGIKGNEKSPAYIEAMSNAKIDYKRKYNRLIALNYPPEEASHWALWAASGQITDPESGKPLSDFEGVLTEIKQNERNNKYIQTGQAVEQQLGAGRARVAHISSGKRELRDDPNIILNGTIGGEYGKRQLDSIVSNIEKYGPDRGLYMNKGAKQYYEGLARGRDGNWMGLLDKQLKAIGHEGLWPNERPPEQDLFEGRDKDGKRIEDPNGLLPLAKQAERAGKYPSAETYKYIVNILKEGQMFDRPTTVWDTNENLAPWVFN